MRELIGTPLRTLPVAGLEHIRDLAWHDGSLISHFRHKKGDDYLYLWADCSDSATRWMLMRVAEVNILRLVEAALPLDRVIPNECLDDFVYFIDAGEPDEDRVHLVQIADIPSQYLPRNSVYLDVSELAESPEFSVLIEGAQRERSIFSLPRLFSQAYGVLYSLLILRPLRYDRIPWKDGLRGYDFGNYLMRLIPGQDRPEVREFRFASPGYVKFSLVRQVADSVSDALQIYRSVRAEVDSNYRTLELFIREEKLNDLNSLPTHDQNWTKHDDSLKLHTNRLMAALGLEDGGKLLSAAKPFEAAKIILYFIRRLRELCRFEDDGVVRFPLARQSLLRH